MDIQLTLARRDFSLDVDLHLPDQGITVLFGASGSGKTTVLRCIAGLEPEARGLVRMGDEVWLATADKVCVPTHQRRVGYVFQEASLFAHLNVRHNIEFGAHRVRGPDAARLLAQAVALLGIGHLMERTVEALSGGERQRVAIARALATQPKVLLLDEPLAALDLHRKREVFPWLERLRDELRIPMVYVTHAVDELTRLGDHLVVMDGGRVRVQGPVTETLSALDARGLDGQEPGVLLDGRVEQLAHAWGLARVAVPGGYLWVRDDGAEAGARVRLRVLARDVSVATREPSHTSIQNHFEVTLEAMLDDEHPSQTLLKLRWGECAVLARITRRACAQLALQVGQPLWAQVKSVAVVH
jgi:molybdate transport system ATP-binding protein